MQLTESLGFCLNRATHWGWGWGLTISVCLDAIKFGIGMDWGAEKGAFAFVSLGVIDIQLMYVADWHDMPGIFPPEGTHEDE